MKKGFTLIEVVIAILVLSVSTLVVIAMQTSTLRGYSSIRDTDDAVMIAHRTADIMHINATSWRVDPANNWSFDIQPSYSDITPFDVSNPLSKINTNRWSWIPLYDEPVDGRMTGTTGRHCVYVRGGPFAGSLTTTKDAADVIDGSPAMVVQIAVVSSGVRNSITNCVTPAFEPNNLAIPGAEIAMGEALELEGYRPTYHGTVVFQRDFL